MEKNNGLSLLMPAHVRLVQEITNLDFDYLSDHNIQNIPEFVGAINTILEFTRQDAADIERHITEGTWQFDAFVTAAETLEREGVQYHKEDGGACYALCRHARTAREMHLYEPNLSLVAKTYQTGIGVYLESQTAAFFNMLAKHFTNPQGFYVPERDWRNILTHKPLILTDTTRAWDACYEVGSERVLTELHPGCHPVFSRWYDVTSIESRIIFQHLLAFFMRHPLYHVISYEMSRRLRSVSKNLRRNLNFSDKDDLQQAFEILLSIPHYKDAHLKNIIGKWLSICLIAYTYNPSEYLLIETYTEPRDFSLAEKLQKECRRNGIPLTKRSTYR